LLRSFWFTRLQHSPLELAIADGAMAKIEIVSARTASLLCPPGVNFEGQSIS